MSAPDLFPHLIYTEDGIIKYQVFLDEKSRMAWIGQFTIDHMDNTDDNTIDMLFYGKVEITSKFIRFGG